MKNTGTNNNSGVDPKKVIQTKPIMIKEGVNGFSSIGVLCLIILFFLSFFSCSPSKRINRIVKNNPELMVKDTITVFDTLIFQTVIHDTTTKFIEHKTVEVINNDKVRLQYKYDTITNEINHYVECKGDTIVRSIRVPYNKIQPVTVNKGFKYFGWGVLAGLLIILVLFILKKVN